MTKYILALGTSQDKGEQYLINAKKAIAKIHGIKICGSSAAFKNGSYNTHYNCIFINSSLAVETAMHPKSFFRELVAIEHRFGRIRTYENAKRTLDVDVLMSLDLNYKSDSLLIPHREAFVRNFFVIPAIEAINDAGWPMPHVLWQASQRVVKKL